MRHILLPEYLMHIDQIVLALVFQYSHELDVNQELNFLMIIAPKPNPLKTMTCTCWAFISIIDYFSLKQSFTFMNPYPAFASNLLFRIDSNDYTIESKSR